MFQISRLSDNTTAQLYTDESAKIVQLIVTSTSQTLTTLSDIYSWVGDITFYHAYLDTWYDQSGNGRHLYPNLNRTTAYLRLISDKGQFPAVYLTGNAFL